MVFEWIPAGTNQDFVLTVIRFAFLTSPFFLLCLCRSQFLSMGIDLVPINLFRNKVLFDSKWFVAGRLMAHFQSNRWGSGDEGFSLIRFPMRLERVESPSFS